MTSQNSINIGCGKGLLPDGSTLLLEPMSTMNFCGIHLRTISEEKAQDIYPWLELEILIEDYKRISLGSMR